MPNLTLRRSPWRTPMLSPFARNRDPFGPDMSRVFDLMFTPASTDIEPVGLMPAVDLSETDDAWTCVVDLPGMKAPDVDVSFDDGVLRIKGEKKDERETKEGKRYHMWERTYGAFERSFTFPSHVQADKIKAEFTDGVLTVIVPKATNNGPKARKITVGGK